MQYNCIFVSFHGLKAIISLILYFKNVSVARAGMGGRSGRAAGGLSHQNPESAGLLPGCDGEVAAPVAWGRRNWSQSIQQIKYFIIYTGFQYVLTLSPSLYSEFYYIVPRGDGFTLLSLFRVSRFQHTVMQNHIMQYDQLISVSIWMYK
jgi:hypothetical protein